MGLSELVSPIWHDAASAKSSGSIKNTVARTFLRGQDKAPWQWLLSKSLFRFELMIETPRQIGMEVYFDARTQPKPLWHILLLCKSFPKNLGEPRLERRSHSMEATFPFSVL